MNKILTATSRGQITLPKFWRDKMQTSNLKATIDDNRIIIEPLYEDKTLTEVVENSWDEYKEGKGKVVTHEEVIKNAPHQEIP